MNAARTAAQALVVLLVAAPATAVDYLDLPAARFPPAGWVERAWNDPGGWIEIDVTTQGITPGSDTVAADLQALIDAASAPTVFYFPPGEYTLHDGIDVASDIIIRGAGADQTRLLLSGTAGPISFSGGWDPVSADITSDLVAGSTSVPVTDASGFAIGDLLRIDQELPAWAETWGARAHGQIVFVTEINGDTLEIDMPLALAYSTSASAQAHKMNLVQNAGIERLYLERLAHNDAETIFIKRAYNVFVRYLESYNTAKYHIYVARARRVLVHGNYIHHAWDYGGGGHGYGVDLMETSTRCLVFDNVLEELRHHLIYATGANHCVVAYNFNVDIENPDDILTDVCGHGHWENHNLFEGNVAWWYYIDNVWGPAGPENTFFRNLAQGKPGSWHGGEGLTILDDSDRQNVIANLLVNDSTTLFGPDVDDLFTEGNVLSGSPQWDTLPSDAALPPSLYLDGAPGFWTAGLAWPPFGPDVADAVTNKIPAQLRYEQGSPVGGGDSPDAGGGVDSGTVGDSGAGVDSAAGVDSGGGIDGALFTDAGGGVDRPDAGASTDVTPAPDAAAITDLAVTADNASGADSGSGADRQPEATDAMTEPIGKAEGCACRSAGSTAGWLGALALLAGLAGRRRLGRG